MILNTRHVGIVVQDMEKSLHFWRDVMGLKVAIDFWEQGEFIDTVQHLSGVNLHMVKLTAPDGSMIELLKDEAHPTPPPERGMTYVTEVSATLPSRWPMLKNRGGLCATTTVRC